MDGLFVHSTGLITQMPAGPVAAISLVALMVLGSVFLACILLVRVVFDSPYLKAPLPDGLPLPIRAGLIAVEIMSTQYFDFGAGWAALCQQIAVQVAVE